ncbi:hypothetical protein BAL199_28870 [alpha proteobacterium BAL199]|nr:hypothetical protein BAL199_28870 [alpha proteobacterium BAL199]
MRLGLHRRQVGIGGECQPCRGVPGHLEAVDVGDALLDGEDQLAGRCRERRHPEAGDDVGAIGLAVVAGERLGHAVELRRRGLVHQHAVLGEVDGNELAGGAVAGPAPGEADPGPPGTRLLVVARPDTGVEQRRVLQLSDVDLGEPHADGDTGVDGNGEAGGRDRADGATDVDRGRLELEAAGHTVEDGGTAADHVAVAEQRVAEALHAVDQHVLQLIQLGWGFFGSIRHHADPDAAWAAAVQAIAAATRSEVNAVGDFLDSRHGRHFADDVVNGLAAGRELDAAITAAVQRWMGWTIGRRTARETGIPMGLPYLTGFVIHCEIEADSDD